MKDDVASFLKEIQQTTVAFSEGTITFNEALQQYSNFKHKLNDYASDQHYENYVLNMLATHNAVNFSLFSAIVVYNVKEDTHSFAIHHGPALLLQDAAAGINKNYFSSPPRFILDYMAHNSSIQNFTVHSSLLFHSKAFAVIFTAMSSSSFFSRETFYQYAAHAKALMFVFDMADIMSLDIPQKSLRYIHQACTKMLTHGHCSLYGIRFISPFKTLSHYGLYALNDVSRIIKKTLMDKFGSHCFALSMNLYLCITSQADSKIKSLPINYKDVVIPSKIYHKPIENQKDIFPAIIHMLDKH